MYFGLAPLPLISYVHLPDVACSSAQLVAVHLMDAHHITDASRYVSLLLLSLRAMLTLELPHINVLSKVDLLGDGADLGKWGYGG